MYKITPLHPLARDTKTRDYIPAKGIEREQLTTADYLQERTGDTAIQMIEELEKKAKK